MAKQQKYFESAMFGYYRKAVEEKCDNMEREIKFLKEKIENMEKDYSEKYRLLEEKEKQAEESKKRIAEVYIEAQKTADNMLQQAKDEIVMERHRYEVENESLKEVIVERKEAIRNIRLSVQTFSEELESYFERVIKSLSNDISTTVKELDYEHLEKISANNDLMSEEYTIQSAEENIDKERMQEEEE